MKVKSKFFKVFFVCICLCFMVALTSTAAGMASEQEKADKLADIPGVTTFYEKANEPIWTQDGKPTFYLFSVSQKTKPQEQEIFESVVKDYMGQGKIVAHHWNINTKDDSLTPKVETQISGIDYAVLRFAILNYFGFPLSSDNYLIFGGKFYRMGKGHEDPETEKKEFRDLIDHLVGQVEAGYPTKNTWTGKTDLLAFSWSPGFGADYYNVYVAVDPEDPLNPKDKEFKLVATTNQPNFCFLGKKGKVYVLQTESVCESACLVVVRRGIGSADYQLEQWELKKDSLITLENPNPTALKIFVDTVKSVSPRSEPSNPTICMETGDPKEFPNYKMIP